MLSTMAGAKSEVLTVHTCSFPRCPSGDVFDGLPVDRCIIGWGRRGVGIAGHLP